MGLEWSLSVLSMGLGSLLCSGLGMALVDFGRRLAVQRETDAAYPGACDAFTISSMSHKEFASAHFG